MSENKKWKPSAQQRAVLEGLVAEAQKEKSVEAFCKKFLTFGSSQFSQIIAALDDNRPASYFDSITNRDAKMDELAEDLTRIQLQRAADNRVDSDFRILPLEQFRAVQRAVKESKFIRGPERLIKYLAPTGGGKTILAQFLQKDNNLRVVESREAWRRSYFTFLNDLCRAIKIPIAGENRPSTIEDILIPRLCEKEDDMSIVLFIDEAEFFGREALNGLKLLLNKTRVVPVIAAIPEAHEKWNRYYPMEADQIARRTRAVFELSVVSPKDAALFFVDDQFAEPDEEIKSLAKKAEKFGHYSLLRRVARKLHGVKRAKHDDVEKAVTASLTEMRRLERTASIANPKS